MKSVAALLMIVALLAMLPGCGATFVGGAVNFTSVTGTVSIVRLTASGDGTQFTFVTLVQTSGSQDLNFCGNVVHQFPMNTMVTAKFTPGTPCNSVVSVVIVI
jgi:hypothetical protein